MKKALQNRRNQRFFTSLLLTPIIFFIFYLIFSFSGYQRLVNEGSAIADKECLNVNPIIIERKKSFNRSLQYLKDRNADAYIAENKNYISLSEKYISAQRDWLSEQEAFTDRRDFQYFMPGLIKELAELQITSREADVASTRYIIDALMVSELEVSLSEKLSIEAVEQMKRRDEADKKYDELMHSKPKLDWRAKYVKIPETKCTKEQLDIPNVNIFNDLENLPTDTTSPLS